MSEQDTRGFRRLVEFIGEEMDFESGFYNDDYLDRRITARMRRVDLDDYSTYRRLLTRDEGERAALLDSLSINVTGFFRNPEAWEALGTVLADLTDQHRSVRIWSAPCADGREPYSLAMLAMDHDDVSHQRVEILGTDINDDILEVARRGVYETSQTTDIEAELEPLSNYRRYVERHDDTFEVRDIVRDMVSFERHDLIRGDDKRDFDLVCCRNLLIYIDSSYKSPIFRTIRGSLRDGGYLMIGMTETLPAECRSAFDPVAKQYRIYRRT
jgi:chemotaxis protein methyltransferase CheR